MRLKSESNASITSIDLVKADERYHFKLSDILRKRCRPLLLVIDSDGALVYSSVPDDAPAYDHRLLGQALAEARSLFNGERQSRQSIRQLIIEKPGERCALVALDNDFYSLKVFPLHGPIDDVSGERYAAIAEPIVKPLAEGIDFKCVQQKWHLSPREVDVLRSLMCGDTDKEIARDLDVAVETVRAYLKSIRAKLGVNTRTAIVHVIHQLHSEMHREDVDRRI